MPASKRTRWLLGAAGLAAILVAASPVYGIFNANFTPRHLIENSSVIIELKLKPADKPKILVGEVVRVLKGKDRVEKGDILIDLNVMPEDQAKDVADSVAAKPNQHVLLFAGEFGASGEPNLKAALHQGGRWLTLDGSKKAYSAVAINGLLEPTWAGGTDMLIKAVESGVEDAQLDFPVETGVRWQAPKKVFKIEGPVHSARQVALGGKPGGLLHVGAAPGDRLFQFDPEARSLRDVTAQFKLTARSTASVWGDFNHDGRLDLASWDGKALSLHLQGADGAFQAKALDTGEALKAGCVGLAIIDVGKKGLPALVASAPDRPVLLVPQDNGSYSAAPLAADDALPKNPGPGSPCLVADFDGDGLPDIIQVFEKSSLAYKGKGAGGFEKPVVVAMGRGPGRGEPFLGDFDHDGQLDIFCVGDDRCRLWQNLGGFKFEEWLKKSGEAAYKCASGGIGGMTCDFNNDGRQDLLILYKDMGPQFFFNRGFRSFGDAVAESVKAGVAPTVKDMDVDDASQQAGCMADLDGDGAQEMVLVLKGGELILFTREPGEKGAALVVNVALPLDGGCAGPVTVVGWKDQRCLGAWNVTAGSAEAFVARSEPGAVKLRWQFPGGKPQEKEITLEDKPLRFLLKP